jgi:ribosomal protein L11 methyltransferase
MRLMVAQTDQTHYNSYSFMNNTTFRAVHEISFSVSRLNPFAAELLKAVLIKYGICEKDIVDFENRECRKLIIYESSGKRRDRIIKKFRSLELKGIGLVAKTITRADWQDKWRKTIRPFALGKRFVVIPLWNSQRSTCKRRVPIYLETALAFGTGLHETTRFMAQLIERCQGRFANFLDVGTGTGILAIVAAKCGARMLTAIDYDGSCLPVAKKNLAVNQIRSCQVIKADVNVYPIEKQVDFVAANLHTVDLIRFGKKLTTLVRPGKYLAISGISIPHFKSIRESFRKLPLRCIKICKGKEWVAILNQRARR